MMVCSRPRSLHRFCKQALSLAETLISVVVVAVMLPAVLSTIGAAKVGQAQTVNRQLGRLLAQSLMTEVLLQDYAEPTDSAVFGKEGGESALSRIDFDDVDDYHQWSASPPQSKDGTVIPERTGWGRRVVVDYVLVSDPQQSTVSDTGVKRITVTVTHNAIEVASLVAIRSGAVDRSKTPD